MIDCVGLSYMCIAGEAAVAARAAAQLGKTRDGHGQLRLRGSAGGDAAVPGAVQVRSSIHI